MTATMPAVAEPTDRKIPVPLLLVPFGTAMVCSRIARFTWPTLAVSSPLLLIALSSSNRYLILAAPQLSPVAFFTVGFLRLIATDPFSYLLGRQHGESAIGWIERRSTKKDKRDALIRKAQRLFNKASVPFIIFAPGALWCLMAGAARMKVALFAVCNVTGTIGRLALIWWIGQKFEEPIQNVLDFVKDYQLPLMGLAFSLGIIQLIRSQRRRRLEAETLAEVEAAG